MCATGKYIYAIIDSGRENVFGPWGINACEEVYTIPYKDISCVVSDSEVMDFSGMQKDALARRLIGHQKVAEKIMNEGSTVIPVRLGTFGKDSGEVREILSRSYAVAREIFSKVCGRVEIDVAATWSDFNLVIKEIGEEGEIREFKERIQAEERKVTADDQMKVGVMVKNALERRRDDYAQKLREFLRAASCDFKNHEVMDDGMVANIAFLVDKPRQKAFEAAVEALDAGFGGKLNFRCVGPLPPYSFYTLEVKKMEYEDVDRARQKLGVSNGTVTEEEIKKAYYRQSLPHHPDKNPGKPGAEREFEDINRAYKTLLEYCGALRQAGLTSFSFSGEGFGENALLVRVRE